MLGRLVYTQILRSMRVIKIYTSHTVIVDDKTQEISIEIG